MGTTNPRRNNVPLMVAPNHSTQSSIASRTITDSTDMETLMPRHRKKAPTNEERLALPKSHQKQLKRIAKQLAQIERETPYELFGKRLKKLNWDLRIIKNLLAAKVESYESNEGEAS